METVYGIVKGGLVVPAKGKKLTDGTRVLMVPQSDFDKHWLTSGRAATITGATVAQVRRWVKSGKVRVHPSNPRLVNVGDVEDALEQDELLELTMTSVSRRENA